MYHVVLSDKVLSNTAIMVHVLCSTIDYSTATRTQNSQSMLHPEQSVNVTPGTVSMLHPEQSVNVTPGTVSQCYTRNSLSMLHPEQSVNVTPGTVSQS